MKKEDVERIHEDMRQKVHSEPPRVIIPSDVVAEVGEIGVAGEVPAAQKLGLADRLAFAFKGGGLSKKDVEGPHCNLCGVELAAVKYAKEGLCSNCASKYQGGGPLPRSVARAVQQYVPVHTRRQRKKAAKVERFKKDRAQSPLMRRLLEQQAQARGESKNRAS